MTIGHTEVDEKTNKIPAMLNILKLFNYSGRIITADAIHCQKATCQTIVAGDSFQEDVCTVTDRNAQLNLA
jgi:predicted transposase YbfD/YdcC